MKPTGDPASDRKAALEATRQAIRQVEFFVLQARWAARLACSAGDLHATAALADLADGAAGWTEALQEVRAQLRDPGCT